LRVFDVDDMFSFYLHAHLTLLSTSIPSFETLSLKQVSP